MTRTVAGFLRRGLSQGADRGGAVLRAGGSDRGASAIEFVFLTPLLFLMIFGAVQFAMYSFGESVAKAAAQAGARTARAQADADPAGWSGAAEQKAYDYIDQLGRGLFESRPDVDSARLGDNTVRVEVTARVPSILPWLDLTVRASSEGPVERFVPDDGG